MNPTAQDRWQNALRISLMIVVLVTTTTARAQWQSAGVLNIPDFHYTFLAATPGGDLIAATFHSTAPSPPVDMPAILIKNPMSATPEVKVLCATRFDSMRGYGGIACDSNGSFFVSGDTGDRATSFVRKFNADGTPDTRFGTGGEIRPNRRCLGMDVLGNFLLLAVDWGEIMILDSATGAPKATIPDREAKSFMRDLTIDPKSLRIFGVAQGGVLMWGRGTPWSPGPYVYEQFAVPTAEAKAGEGISIDPILRCILITPVPGNTLHEVFGNRQIRKTTIETAGTRSHLCDTSLSSDGTVLFISDMFMKKIHVMKRPYPQNAAPTGVAAGATGAAVVDSGAAQVPPPAWNRNYTQALQAARQANKPMLVYFRRPGVKACEDFEKNVLLTNEFNRRAQPYMCVFEDAGANRLLAQRLGIFRVPHVVILDRAGETKAEYSFNINSQQLFGAMESFGK